MNLSWPVLGTGIYRSSPKHFLQVVSQCKCFHSHLHFILSVMSDISKFLNASQKAVDFFLKHLDPQGALNAPDAPRDICVYYKLVTLMLVSGRNLEANRILDHIQKSFLQPNGDLRSKADGGRENKSVSGALCEYCAYSNGWIAMAAQRTGRFDISYPTWAYMEKFFHPTLGGATTRAPYGEENNVMDVLSTAHLGLTALYFGGKVTLRNNK